MAGIGRFGTLHAVNPKCVMLRILVADDSIPVRERMAALLNELPCVEVVAESNDVPTTIECVAGQHPDVVILDISMPGGSGLDVLQTIRTLDRPPLVVVLTNHTDPEYETQARNLGASAFLNKSRDFLKAVDFVRDLADWKSASRSFNSIAGHRTSGIY